MQKNTFHSIWKTKAKKFPDDFSREFWSVHLMDSLLSHEAMGEDLWMAVEWRSCDSNTMEDVVRPNLIHTNINTICYIEHPF